MVRYKSKESIKNKVEQKQLLSTSKLGLKINTILTTGNPTLLKTNMSYTDAKTQTQTQSKLKRKLLVYKKDDKFYVDNSAAYALKLTNVRAIMTGNTHLVELSKENIYKFQNDEDIEIEYQELEQEQEVETRKGDLAESLSKLEQDEYGIGIHGINQGRNNEENLKIASSICKEGLKINNNSKTILSTAISLGTNENTQQISREIMNYKYGNGAKTNVIIAVPNYIQNEDGEKIFLGFPEENVITAGQQYDEHCILDRICAKMRKIPTEFILGYYSEDSDKSEIFMKNEQHYSNITQDKKENLYKELFQNMDDISKNYNDLINDSNIEQLKQIKEGMREFGWDSYIADNAMMLAQKYKGKSMTQDSMKKKDDSIIKEDLPTPEKTRRTRRILLDATSEIKSSDVANAKETLRRGLEEQKENYGEKEI